MKIYKMLKCLTILGLAVMLTACGSKNLQTSIENGAKKLSSSELQELLIGSTVKSSGAGLSAEIHYLAGGTMKATNGAGEKDKGKWKVDGEDRLCLAFKKWGQGDKICYQVYRDGDNYKQFNRKGMLVYTFTVLEQGSGDFQEGITFSGTTKTKQPATTSGPVTPIRKPRPQLPVYTPKTAADADFFVRQSARNCPGCNLAHTDLSGMNLIGANLEGANLAGTDLSDAALRRANLKGANLYRANLRGANLLGADLSGANLTDADLTDAQLPSTVDQR